MPILTPSPCLTPSIGSTTPFRSRSRASSAGSPRTAYFPATSSALARPQIETPEPSSPPVQHKVYNASHGVILYAPDSPISRSPPTYFRVEAFRLQAHSSVLADRVAGLSKVIPLSPPPSDNGEETEDGLAEAEMKMSRGEVIELEEDARIVELLLKFVHPPVGGMKKGYAKGGLDLKLEYDLAVAFLKAVDKYQLYAARAYAVETLGGHLNSWGDRTLEIYGLAQALGYDELIIEAAEHSISFDIARVEPEIMDAMGPIAAVEIYRHHALHSRRRRVVESLIRSVSRLPPAVVAPTLAEHTSGVCWQDLSNRWSRFCDDLIVQVDSRFDWHDEKTITSFVESVETQCPACADALKQIVACVEMPSPVPRFEPGAHFIAQ